LANQVVSTSLNYDSASILGLANGETITVQSDAVLTMDSDSRWGQNAAVFGNITISQGELFVDGTKVWWIPFDGGTGNVPSLGTVGTPDVTRSGNNVGEFLGIFTALGVAPSSGAMPSTGFLKLRTKTVTFADNDVLTLTGGATVTVNSTTGGQRGWLHIVGAETLAVSVPRLGKVTITGDWFDLGVSNGTSGQVFQHYVSDFVSALQVETGSGTGVYEWWGCVPSAEFTATNCSTDDRGRYYTCSSAGVITFGGATFGKLPPNGAKIRVPNIHLSSSPSPYTANAVSATTSNRDVIASTGGILDIQYLSCNGSVSCSNAPLYQVKYSTAADGGWSDNAVFGSSPNSNNSQVRFEDVAASRVTAANILQYLMVYSSDVQFKKCASFQPAATSGTSTGCFYLNNITGLTLDTCLTFSHKTITPNEVSYSTAVVIKDSTFVSAASANNISLTGCSDVSMTNNKITSKHVDADTATTTGVLLTNCGNVVIDGVSLFVGTTLPSLYLINAQSQTTNIRIRNIGTRGSPIVAGSAMRYIVLLNNVFGAYLSKIYQNGGSQAVDCAYNLISCDEVFASDCGDPTAYTASSVFVSSTLGSTNTAIFKRTASGGSKVMQASTANGATPFTFPSFGTHFMEQEVSATEIWLTVNCGIEKSSSVWSTNAYVDDVGTILRDGTNGLLLRTLNDQTTWTWNYWIRGLSSFANTAPIISGTNTVNFLIQYDLDKGTGFSGVFKTLSAVNLSAETGIDPSGVKVKIRAKCTTANSANVLKSVTFTGTTSGANVTSYPYPYNEPPVVVNGIVSGTIAAVFNNSTGKKLDVSTGTTQIKLFSEWFADAACTLRVRKAGYDAISSEFTLTESGLTYPVSQVDNSIANTDPGVLGITVTNHGSSPVSWEGKNWSITITVSDSSTASQIAQWVSWYTAQDSFSLGSGLHNMAWPSMIVPSGTSFETVRGTLFGSTGATLKGVRVVNGSDVAISGFTRMQSDDGTYYQPPQAASFVLTGLKENTEVRVYKTSDMSELAGNEDIDTGTFTYNYVWSIDIPITVSIVSLAYQDIQFETTLTVSGTSIPISQQIDRQYSNP